MNLFERYLTLWVGICIVVGIGLGQLFPELFQFVGRIEIAHINLPVAVLVWLMIIPMLIKIDLRQLKGVREQEYLPAEQIDSYIAGLVILAAAPCTAMVFVWSNLMRGEPHFTLSQVALNDVIMVFAFAPIVALLLGLSEIHIPWDTLILSVLLYIVVPLIIASLWRRHLLARDNGEARLHVVWFSGQADYR